jgi:hypothetical protein
VSYRTPLRWTFSAEIQRIEYSDLTDGFNEGVGFLTGARLAAASYLAASGDQIEYSVDDSTVPRFGAEYRHLFGGNPHRALTVQAGYYQTDDVRVRLSGFNSLDPAITEAMIESFSSETDIDHITAGVGFAWGRYGVHASGEASDEGGQFLLSLSFGLGQRSAYAPVGTP